MQKSDDTVFFTVRGGEVTRAGVNHNHGYTLLKDAPIHVLTRNQLYMPSERKICANEVKHDLYFCPPPLEEGWSVKFVSHLCRLPYKFELPFNGVKTPPYYVMGLDHCDDYVGQNPPPPLSFTDPYPVPYYK
jgi:hypothetical protein